MSDLPSDWRQRLSDSFDGLKLNYIGLYEMIIGQSRLLAEALAVEEQLAECLRLTEQVPGDTLPERLALLVSVYEMQHEEGGHER